VRRFRKRPVEVDVMHLVDLLPRTLARVTAWSGAEISYDDAGEPDGLSIPTLEGVLHASEGDWIIRGVHGEHYACKPDIFALTYEPVDGE
jgi:hypothetical protein